MGSVIFSLSYQQNPLFIVVLLKMSDSVIFSLDDIFKTSSSARKYLKIYRPLPTLIFLAFEKFDSKTVPAKVIFFR